VSMNAQVVGFRRLYIPSVTDNEGWRRDAVIVKVRLEREGRFWRSFETRASVNNEEG
jgi:hypothetical protein